MAGSGDDAFNKEVDALIRGALSGFDEYERKLGAEPIDTQRSELWCYN